MLIVSYSPLLVLAAALVALMAAFTGMHLTHGLSRMPADARKTMIVKAAIVLGGGVWATHFVAMLALDLPVAVFYDALLTLGSALIAILMAGAALLLLHFGPRTDARVAVAGAILGCGVVAMHYLGMSGMRGCIPVFAPEGYVVSSGIAVAMGMGALKLAYGRRTRESLTFGAVLFALAILAMHFTAMRWTGFIEAGALAPRPGLVANEVLALFVVVVAFLICGAFLLTTATLGAAEPAFAETAGPAPAGTEEPPVAPVVAAVAIGLRRVPYEQDGRTYYAAPDEIVAIQAEGHYTRLLRAGEPLFCPMAIAKLEAGLSPQQFVRTHRSFLVNLRHVHGFERRKDQGVCLFDPALRVPPVPVSRSRVGPIMRALGIEGPSPFMQEIRRS